MVLKSELSNDGPWLIFASENGLWIMNEDGTGLRRLLPDAITYPWWIDHQVSPDGKRIAYVEMNNVKDENRLVLKILSLPNGVEEAVIPLLNENLTEEEIFWAERSVEYVWAPNGYRLAFIGSTEGPTPDVYVYNVKNKSIDRLTSGDTAAWNLSWSPNSEYIVHVAGWQGTGAGHNVDGVWASKADGSDNRFLYLPAKHAPGDVVEEDYKLPSGGETVIAWASKDEALVMSWYIDHGSHGLRKVDLVSGEITYIFDAYISDIAVAQIRKLALVSVYDPYQDFLWPGLYLIQLDGSSKKQLIAYDELDWEPFRLSWLPNLAAFLALGRETYIVSPTGEMTPYDLSAASFPKYSPSGVQWVQTREGEIWLGEGSAPQRKIFAGEVFRSVWSPDGNYLVIFSAGEEEDLYDLYVAESPEFEPVLIASAIQIDRHFRNYSSWVEPW
jgi:WD40 repeat protein